MSDDTLANVQIVKKPRKRTRRSGKTKMGRVFTEKREIRSIYTTLQNLHCMVPGLDACGKTTKLQKMRGVVQYASFLETTLENLSRENEIKLNFEYKLINRDQAPSNQTLNDEKNKGERTPLKSTVLSRRFTYCMPTASSTQVSSSQASATQTSSSYISTESTEQTPLLLSPPSPLSLLDLPDLPDYLSDDANPFIDSQNDRWLVEHYEPEIETTVLILSQSLSNDIMKL